jgi:hypothetical protein
MQRQNELHSDNGQIGFRAYERVDGKVTLAAAIIALKHAGPSQKENQTWQRTSRRTQTGHAGLRRPRTDSPGVVNTRQVEPIQDRS